MRIAFHAPMKSPNHPVPSGDRQMARLLMKALDHGGFDAELASRLRAFRAEPGPLDGMKREAASEKARLGQAWAQHGKPDLWFTYHLYYKAPDLLGPDLAREGLLDIMSSDYIPSSLLMAAMQLPRHVPAIDLAAAVRTVTKTAAEAVGLNDRGEIAVGKRADLIRVHVAHDVPAVRSVWREGHRVA